MLGDAQPAAPDADEDWDWATLSEAERFWRDNQKYLESKGYLLRPRYHPDWVPSWRDTSLKPQHCADSARPRFPDVLDATRVTDGAVVILKRVNVLTHPQEWNIMQYFSSEPLASHPNNRCVPVYDAFPVPDDEQSKFVVMPLLRTFNDPPFETVGEAIEALKELIEGIQFMHQCRVTHRDIKGLNFMFDGSPLYRQKFHPIHQHKRLSYKFGLPKPHTTRTARPTKYYIIDFGISLKYDADNLAPRALPIPGGHHSLPEFQSPREPCDPFAGDIYDLGCIIQVNLLKEASSFRFLEPLVADMVINDPEKRPKIDNIATRFDELVQNLKWYNLRSRVVYNEEEKYKRVFRAIGHAFRTVGHIVARRPAIPTAT